MAHEVMMSSYQHHTGVATPLEREADVIPDVGAVHVIISIHIGIGPAWSQSAHVACINKLARCNVCTMSDDSLQQLPRVPIGITIGMKWY